MNYKQLPAGENLPHDIYIVIEIPAHHAAIKYEINKDYDCLMVDRLVPTPMFYPANYGFINHTLAEDGDALDALIITPHPLSPGSVIRARPIGLLHMTDEAGDDAKIIAVPHAQVSQAYQAVLSYDDLPHELITQIEYFFQHYKDLEKNKWVKTEGWGDTDEAQLEIQKAVATYIQQTA